MCLLVVFFGRKVNMPSRTFAGSRLQSTPRGPRAPACNAMRFGLFDEITSSLLTKLIMNGGAVVAYRGPRVTSSIRHTTSTTSLRSAASHSTRKDSRDADAVENRLFALHDIHAFVKELSKDPQFRLASAVLTKVDMQTALRSRQITIENNLGSPLADTAQMGSSRSLTCPARTSL